MDDETEAVSRECPRCKSRSHFHKRIAEPATSKLYDLFECTVCGNQTWSPVTPSKDGGRWPPSIT